MIIICGKRISTSYYCTWYHWQKLIRINTHVQLCMGALHSSSHSGPSSFPQCRRARPVRECQMWELTVLKQCHYLTRWPGESLSYVLSLGTTFHLHPLTQFVFSNAKQRSKIKIWCVMIIGLNRPIWISYSCISMYTHALCLIQNILNLNLNIECALVETDLDLGHYMASLDHNVLAHHFLDKMAETSPTLDSKAVSKLKMSEFWCYL